MAYVKQAQAKPSRLCSNRSKDFAQKTIFAPCEAMILSTVNRTKCGWVKPRTLKQKAFAFLRWRKKNGC
jgi:hypothetical protein